MSPNPMIPKDEQPGPSSRLLAGPGLDQFSTSFSNNSTNNRRTSCKSGECCLKNCRLVQRLRGYLPDLTARQWQLLTVFAVADFIAGIVYNIKGPFYPAEAQKKGVTAAQFGLVFGIFDLTKAFACPIFGKYMSLFGPKKVFILSMMLISVCSIAFGMLEKIDDATVFLIMSLIIRVLEAFGSAGFSTSTFSIIACEFPATVATTFASLETFFGMGLIVGPLLGGLVFQFGGYDAPFIVTGLLFFTAALVILSVMPNQTSLSSNKDLIAILLTDDTKPAEEGFSIFSVLKIPSVTLAAFGVFAAASSAGFINATLEPHIRQFGLSPLGVGIVFVIYGIIYTLTVPIWGYLCDRMTEPKFITLIGAILNLVTFVLIGPAPFFAFESILTTTCISLVLHGLALGAMFVSGFVLSLRYSIAAGFPNNMATYGVVSGMWTSALSLGMFCGPVIGGVLLDNVGFRWGTVYVLVTMIILIILIVIFLTKNGINVKRNDTYEVPDAVQPLLKSKTVTFYSSDDASAGSSGQAQLISFGSG